MSDKIKIDDVDRSFYDFRFEQDAEDMLESGITPEIINEIDRRR